MSPLSSALEDMIDQTVQSKQYWLTGQLQPPPESIAGIEARPFLCGFGVPSFQYAVLNVLLLQQMPSWYCCSADSR